MRRVGPVRFCTAALHRGRSLSKITLARAPRAGVASSRHRDLALGQGRTKEKRMFVETTIRIHRKGLLENLPKPVLAALPKEHRKSRITAFADYVGRMDQAAEQLNVRPLSSFSDTEDWG